MHLFCLYALLLSLFYQSPASRFLSFLTSSLASFESSFGNPVLYPGEAHDVLEIAKKTTDEGYGSKKSRFDAKLLDIDIKRIKVLKLLREMINDRNELCHLALVLDAYKERNVMLNERAQEKKRRRVEEATKRAQEEIEDLQIFAKQKAYLASLSEAHRAKPTEEKDSSSSPAFSSLAHAFSEQSISSEPVKQSASALAVASAAGVLVGEDGAYYLPRVQSMNMA